MPQKKLNDVKQQDFQEANESLTEKLIAEDSKPVKPVKVMPELVWVKVRNIEDPGYNIGPFFYEDLNAGIPRTSFTFIHDKEHDKPIPRKLMDEINNTRKPIYKNVQTDLGMRSQHSGYEYLYQCIEVRH
jgi:hypothetical protein